MGPRKHLNAEFKQSNATVTSVKHTVMCGVFTTFLLYLNVPAVGGGLLELFPKLEVDLCCLESRAGLDHVVAVFLSDVQ